MKVTVNCTFNVSQPLYTSWNNSEPIAVWVLIVLYGLTVVFLGYFLVQYIRSRHHTPLWQILLCREALPTKQSFLCLILLSNLVRISYFFIWLFLSLRDQTMAVRRVLYVFEALPWATFCVAYIYLIYFWVLMYNTTALPLEIPDYTASKRALAVRKEALKQLRFWGCVFIILIEILFCVAFSLVDAIDEVWIRFADVIYLGCVGYGLAVLFAVYFWKFRKALPEEAVTTSTTRRIQTITWMTTVCVICWAVRATVDIVLNTPVVYCNTLDGSSKSLVSAAIYIVIEIVPSILMCIISQRLSTPQNEKTLLINNKP
eukprot:TRINITY_DN7583_c0_g1_i1.p1 TRINITY_DN7583_c0_g1~~TRINITY_DN7583_c0_g1_i1.p1  ORF type:complete len:345 (+),score=92.41 TRINITY_DN7583_c0_g1_i1:88-1035(+)